MELQLRSGSFPQKSLLNPITNTGFRKGNGGLWTSTYRKKTNDSDWEYWLKREGLSVSEERYIMVPLPSAKIVVLEDEEQALKFCDRFPFGSPGTNHVNWEEVAQVYDAVRVTRRAVYGDSGFAVGPFRGWDCESTHWFRWCFSEVYPVRQEFSLLNLFS